MREALYAPDSGKKFDWGDTWLAEMFRSGQAAELHKAEMERKLGITPEVKRYNEIKAGVIVSSVGIGIAIFLFIFMRGVMGTVSPEAAEILSRVWIAGIIPFMVGVALMINGLVVSKKLVEIAERNEQRAKELDSGQAPRTLRPAEPSEFIPAGMNSVTEHTTRHLAGVERERKVD